MLLAVIVEAVLFKIPRPVVLEPFKVTLAAETMATE